MSGALMALMGGYGGAVVSLTSFSITDTQSVIPASSAYRLTNGGAVQSEISTGAITARGNWITPASGFSGYEARATQTATNGNGTLSGTVGSWLNLGTTREWELAISGGGGTATRTLTIEIRDAVSLAVLATASINFTATST